MLISSVMPSCTASEPRRSDSIAERESVATGTSVGDWDAAAMRGTVCGHAQWKDTLLGRSMRACQLLHDGPTQGDHLSWWSRKIAQRIQMRAQRETTSRPSSGLRHTFPEKRRPLQGTIV
ncbi:thimet oligopeptidase [Trypanosoma cruzi]|nr:thimet oligopeptidase [Trypanosoma cruzi]